MKRMKRMLNPTASCKGSDSLKTAYAAYPVSTTLTPLIWVRRVESLAADPKIGCSCPSIRFIRQKPPFLMPAR